MKILAKPSTIDPTGWTSLHEHPRMQEAHVRVEEAQRTLAVVQERYAAARADLDVAEQAAADGHRDDKRLRHTRATLDAEASDLRIAELAVERAQQTARETLAEVCVEVERNLTERHIAATRALERALQQANDCSHAVAALEDVSSRLFVGGMYRTLPGKPLPRTAWRREFGGPGGRFDTWRSCCGVRFDE